MANLGSQRGLVTPRGPHLPRPRPAPPPTQALAAAVAALALLAAWLALAPRRSLPVYLLSFHCFRPPDRCERMGLDAGRGRASGRSGAERSAAGGQGDHPLPQPTPPPPPFPRLRVSRQKFLQLSRDCGAFDARALEFQEKMVWKGGLGDDTYLPDGGMDERMIGFGRGMVVQRPAPRLRCRPISGHHWPRPASAPTPTPTNATPLSPWPAAMHVTPPAPTLAAARAEAEMVMFACVEAALAEAGVAPKDVDAVVVNCSLFNPTPSLSAMVVNHFKMRRDVVAYSLGGMGCSAGVIAIALAQELLQTYPNSKVGKRESGLVGWWAGGRGVGRHPRTARQPRAPDAHRPLPPNLVCRCWWCRWKTSPKTGTLATNAPCSSPTACSA